MPIVSKAICCVCGETKGKINHWWTVYITETFTIFPFSPSTVSLDETQEVVCSYPCALKMLSKFMGEK
jgi:hypothetical protein